MKNTTAHSYRPRPFRESYGSRTAHDIQRDLELMRAMYAQRRSLNHPRHQSMVGWSLVTVAVVAPIVAALVILL